MTLIVCWPLLMHWQANWKRINDLMSNSSTVYPNLGIISVIDKMQIRMCQKAFKLFFQTTTSRIYLNLISICIYFDTFFCTNNSTSLPTETILCWIITTHRANSVWCLPKMEKLDYWHQTARARCQLKIYLSLRKNVPLVIVLNNKFSHFIFLHSFSSSKKHSR